MSRNTGGPVFPKNNASIFNSESNIDGMTLRDYFAGQALSGMATLYAQANGNEESIIESNARLSYAMADAMILERDK